MRHHHLRHGVVAGLTLALLAAVPVAFADPVPGPEADDGHHHGDHFAEGLQVAGDPFVVPDATAAQDLVSVMPTSPMDWVGAPPDPSHLPQEWLVEQPAQEITPSSGQDLMTASDGYLGGGFGELGAGPTLSDAELLAVPAPPTKDLPSTLDAAPPWQYSYSCDPNNKPGMVALANLLADHYDRPTWYGSRSCIQGDNSQHYEGRAFDWSMNAYDPEQKAIGDSVAQWLTANNGEMARRFGVQSIIWNRQAWYLYKPGYWSPYYGASPHTDHLHISFSWDGAMGRTSWWDGSPITNHDYGTCRVFAASYAPRYQGVNGTVCSTNLPSPPYAPNPVVLPGANNNYVRQAQQYLGFTGGDVDGAFGPATLQALLNYQAAYDLPWTGVLDKSTWAYMIEAGIPTDPVPPPDPDPVPPPPDPDPEPDPDPTPGVERISAGDRYATAALVAANFPVGSPLFITVGEDYPDALAAAARAGSLGGPVLLTRTDTLPGSTRAAITRLKPSKVTIVGGEGAITGNVLAEVKTLTTAPVTRIGGEDRYATAGELAKTFGNQVDVVYVATGANYPDALAGAARAGYNDGPVLLTQKDEIPSATVSAMAAINPYRVVVLGGRNAISSPVATELKLMTRSKNLQRVFGPDRYGTAAELAQYYPNGLDTVVVATGEVFPDALSGAAWAGDQAGPVLLVSEDDVPWEARQALSQLDPQEIIIVGGPGVISVAVEELLATYVG